MRSYQKQRPHLQIAANEMKPATICLQESCLKPNLDASSPQYHYPPLRCDRTEAKPGGVAMFIHQSFPHIGMEYNRDFEQVAAKVFINQKPINIANVYLPPCITTAEVKVLLAYLETIIPATFILTLDLNAHHTDWWSPQSKLIERGNITKMDQRKRNHTAIQWRTNMDVLLRDIHTYSFNPLFT